MLEILQSENIFSKETIKKHEVLGLSESQHKVPSENTSIVKTLEEDFTGNTSTPTMEWIRFSERVQMHSPVLGGLIRNAVPSEWKGGKLSLGFKSGDTSVMVSEENKKTLER